MSAGAIGAEGAVASLEPNPTPVFNESIGSALIDSARISLMAAMSIIPESRIIVPGAEEVPTLHDCLGQAMEWLDVARALTIAKGGAPPTSYHIVGAPAKVKCIRCGCSDDSQCEDGCWWASTNPPICSRCA